MGDSGTSTSSSSEELDCNAPARRVMPSVSSAADTAVARGAKVHKRTGGLKNTGTTLIKKRYREEIPPPHNYDDDARILEGLEAARGVAQGGGAEQFQRARPASSSIAEMPRSSLGLQQAPTGIFPGASIRSALAEHQFGLPSSSVASRSAVPSGLSESIYSSLSPSARELLLQEQMARNRQAAFLIAQMGYNADVPSSRMHDRAPPRSDLLQRYLSLPGLAQPDYWRGSGSSDTGFGASAGFGGSTRGGLVDQYRLQLLQQQQQQQLSLSPQQHGRGLAAGHDRPSPPRPPPRPIELSRREDVAARAQFPATRQTDSDDVDLPPCTEVAIPPLNLRRTFPLGIDEDTNWLSEFHCFIRAELIEVFQASHEDVKARNTSIVYKQIGLRCRYCAHRSGNAKAGRSSAFPSTIRQIYQSFTMMLRDHFPKCDAITGEIGDRYNLLKDKPSQGATDSKRYWVYSGLKIGMADSKEGIYMTKETRLEGLSSLPFGVDPNIAWRDDVYADVSLVTPMDRKGISDFLYLLMSQVQPVRLTEAECIGNRRSLRVGLPGFGCRFCCQQRRLGLCRMFPARRRTLPTKILDFYDHIRRCPLCPSSLKVGLIASKRQLDNKQIMDQGQDREFFDRVWTRLGHDSPPT